MTKKEIRNALTDREKIIVAKLCSYFIENAQGLTSEGKVLVEIAKGELLQLRAKVIR